MHRDRLRILALFCKFSGPYCRVGTETCEQMGNSSVGHGDQEESQSLMAEHHIPYRSIVAGSVSSSSTNLTQKKSVVETYSPSQQALQSGLSTSAEHTFTLLRWCCVGFWFCLCTLGLSWLPYFIVKRNQQNPVQPGTDKSLRSGPKAVSMYKPTIFHSTISERDYQLETDGVPVDLTPSPSDRSPYLEV